MKLNKNALGLSMGIIFAFCMLLMALMSGYLNWATAIVQAMGSLYIGYKATFVGAIIGAMWGFIDGYIFGFVLAWLYNLIAKK